MRRKIFALCVGIAVLLIAVQCSVGMTVWAAENATVVNASEPVWVEAVFEALAPLIGAESAAIMAAFAFAFIGKWGNHEAWNWSKFENTFKVALLNGLIFTALNFLTNWTLADIGFWISQFAALYVMQKFLKAIGPYFSSVLTKLKPG